MWRTLFKFGTTLTQNWRQLACWQIYQTCIWCETNNAIHVATASFEPKAFARCSHHQYGWLIFDWIAISVHVATSRDRVIHVRTAVYVVTYTGVLWRHHWYQWRLCTLCWWRTRNCQGVVLVNKSIILVIRCCVCYAEKFNALWAATSSTVLVIYCASKIHWHACNFDPQ